MKFGIDNLWHILIDSDPLLLKIDISMAFRNVPVDPRDAIKCGVRQGNQYYIDRNLVLGAINVTLIFQRISDAIVHMMRQ